jgi:hypothetical protein
VNGTVHSIQQDFVNPELLFAGTEFGCFFTTDGGKKWIQLKSGIPTIPVRDMVIQKRENDLVLATFGRGFYILDDYSPIRTISKENLDKVGYICPVKDALMYIPKDGKESQGSTVFTSKNPDFGAIFTYYLKEVPKTLKEKRQEKEKELFKKSEPILQPSEEDLRAEKNEIPPYLTFTISDENGNVVRTIRKSPSKGINRVSWDLRYQATHTLEAGEKFDPLKDNGSGIFAMPGKYKVSFSLTTRDESKLIAGPVDFNAVVLNNTTLPAPDRAALVEFHKKVADIARVMQGTEEYAGSLNKNVNDILQSLNSTPQASPELKKKAMELHLLLDEILNVKFNRRTNKPSLEENPPAPVPLNYRLEKIAWATWSSTSQPTQLQLDAYQILKDEFPPVYEQVKHIGTLDLPELIKQMDKIKAPPVPGWLPEYK